MGDSIDNECPNSIPEYKGGCKRNKEDKFRQQELFALLALYQAHHEGRN